METMRGTGGAAHGTGPWGGKDPAELYFVAHQDDELLTFGGVLLGAQHPEVVHVVLCTDGGASAVRHLLAGRRFCWKHLKKHHHALSPEAFIEARDREFRESLRALGILEEHIHIPKERCGDGRLTVDRSMRLMEAMLTRFPEARVHTHLPHSCAGLHPDHGALGEAAMVLWKQGRMAELTLHGGAYEAGALEGLEQRCLPAAALPRLKAAVKAYRTWSPKEGRYAIGVHSVGRLFQAVLKDPCFHSLNLRAHEGGAVSLRPATAGLEGFLASIPHAMVPVVLGARLNGLGIVRSLGEQGIRSVVLDREKGVAAFSRHVHFLALPPHDAGDEAFLDVMEGLGAALTAQGRQGLLYATTDEDLLRVSRLRHRLGPTFLIPLSDPCIVTACYEKSAMLRAATALGLPVPRTAAIEAGRGWGEALKIPFPWMVKPAKPHEMVDQFGKGVLVESKEALAELEEKLRVLGLQEGSFLVQEWIPGPATQLFTYSAYSDREGRVRAYSTGHKIRQHPPDTGTILSGRVVPNGEVERLAEKLLSGIGFHGLSNTEFKWDPRDGEYKLMEINGRSGVWNYSATAAGVNLAHAAYQDMTAGLPTDCLSSKVERVWIYDGMDFLRAVLGRHPDWRDQRLSMAAWRASLRGAKVHAVLQWRDVRPALYFYRRLARRFLPRW